MVFITGLLEVLGANFWLVFIACAEIVAAIYISIVLISRKIIRKPDYESRGIERVFIKEMKRRKGEVSLVLRSSDKLLMYESGDIEYLLGLTVEKLHSDITCIIRQIKDENEGKRIWKRYISWDGDGILSDDFELETGGWIRMSVSRSEDGIYDIISFWNTTEIHKLRSDYEYRLKQAEDASNSKTTFLSRMSHEIRTPMNGIIGMLSLAKGKVEPDSPVMQYIDKAGELSDHMLSLINDILDMSRIEAGKVELEDKPFSIRELGDRLYDMFAKNLEARGIRYEVLYENVDYDCVIGDELRISQVIINFLSNAVKFTSEGEVTVTFRQMMFQNNIVDMLVRVHDTGIGMEAEFINRIFRPFEQENASISKNYGGTGLGMAISDQLVRLMGGEIVVESMKGEGSDFFVYLHLPVVKNLQHKADKKEKVSENNISYEGAFRGRRILLAEDNEINAMIAIEILENMGAKVEHAVNGKEAVDMFESHPARYYDIILMGVQMPVMDGRSAARAIRKLERPDASKILIYALSADAFVEDERLSIESGMNGHFAKPLDFKVLESEIGKYLENE